jgi:hypothetical protein
MIFYATFGDMFSKAAVVAALQRGDVIPDDASDIDRIMQAKIML